MATRWPSGTSASASLRDTVRVPSAGSYRLLTRYAIASGNVSTLDLYVNGTKVATPALVKTGSRAEGIGRASFREQTGFDLDAVTETWTPSVEAFMDPQRAFANEETLDRLRPHGVFGVIAPFNYPVALSVGMLTGAILRAAERRVWCKAQRRPRSRSPCSSRSG